MNPRSRTLAVVVGAVILAGAAGIGVAATGGSSSASATPSMSRPGGPGFDLSALAKELGVSESRLQDALEAARPSAGGQPGADRSGMAETLAEELGLSVDKVQAALDATMPSGGPGGGGGPPSGMDGATPPNDGTTPPSDGAATNLS
jgi:hypothetical protein